MSKFHIIDGFVQVPIGTHGLRATDQANGALLGKLIVTPQHEIWLWAGDVGAAFPDTFYLHTTGAPTEGLLGANVFEYPDAVFPRSVANPNLVNLKVWTLSVAGTQVGLLGKLPDAKLCWVASDVNAERYPLNSSSVMKFAHNANVTTLQQNFNHITAARLVPPT